MYAYMSYFIFKYHHYAGNMKNTLDGALPQPTKEDIPQQQDEVLEDTSAPTEGESIMSILHQIHICVFVCMCSILTCIHTLCILM